MLAKQSPGTVPTIINPQMASSFFDIFQKDVSFEKIMNLESIPSSFLQFPFSLSTNSETLIFC